MYHDTNGGKSASIWGIVAMFMSCVNSIPYKISCWFSKWPSNRIQISATAFTFFVNKIWSFDLNEYSILIMKSCNKSKWQNPSIKTTEFIGLIDWSIKGLKWRIVNCHISRPELDTEGRKSTLYKGLGSLADNIVIESGIWNYKGQSS